eukprot:3701118-Rhodomonas_salina.1
MLLCTLQYWNPTAAMQCTLECPLIGCYAHSSTSSAHWSAPAQASSAAPPTHTRVLPQAKDHAMHTPQYQLGTLRSTNYAHSAAPATHTRTHRHSDGRRGPPPPSCRRSARR